MSVLVVLALLAANQPGMELRLPAASARLPGLWVELTPVDSAAPGKLLLVKPGASSVTVEGDASGFALVCAGGEDLATRCERVVSEPGSLELAGPTAGVQVTGRILVGREAAAGTKVSVVPQPLRLRRPFSLPLYRQGGKLIRSVACDEKGKFTFPHLAPGDYLLDIHLAGGRAVQSEPFTVRLPQPPISSFDLGDLVFGEGIRVEVLVTDSAGQPVKGAGVAINQEKSPAQSVVYEEWADERGRALLSGLDAALPTALACVARGYIRFQERLDPLPPLAQCVLRRFSHLSGTVLDPDDEPIGGATVSDLHSGAETQSDAEGAFSLFELTPGAYKLSVAAPGFEAVEREVALGDEESRKLPAIHLQRAETVVGRVVDAALREPIAGASVTVVEPRGGGATHTDEEGNFHLAIGAEGTVRLAVSAEGKGFPRRMAAVPAEPSTPEEPFEIELARGGWIHVAMWDEALDAPCAGCSATLALPGDRASGLTMDAQGEALSPVLTPGRYQVIREEVRSTGSMVTVSGGADLQWATVEPGRVAEVRFGTKRETIDVLFWPPPSAEWRLLTETASARHLLSADANGAFVVRRIPGEEVALSLMSGSTRLSAGALAADLSEPVVRIKLPSTSVRGLLQTDESPVGGERLLLVSLADGRLAASTLTDSWGAFRVDHLPPGSYSLRRGAPGSEAHVRTFDLTAGSHLDLRAIEAGRPRHR